MRRRLLWLLLRGREERLRHRTGPITLGRLEDSRRPLLFSLLPRMLGGDGTTPRSLQTAFRYVDRRLERVPAVAVSSRRWSRALETSRRLAVRRLMRRAVP